MFRKIKLAVVAYILIAGLSRPASAQLTFDAGAIKSHPVTPDQVDGMMHVKAFGALKQGPRNQPGQIHPPLEVKDEPRYFGSSLGPATNIRVPTMSVQAPSVLRSFATTPSLTGLQPPDPVLAVGPNHVVTTTNEGMRIHALDGTVITFVAWPNFFPATVDGVTAGTFSDPQILYDAFHDRWLLAMTCYDIAHQVGRVWIVRSNTPDPNGAWDGFRVGMRVADDPGDFRFIVDYPRLGMNDDTIYLTGSLFAYPDFQPSGSRLMQIDLNALELPAPVLIGDTWTGFATDVVCPAVMRSHQSYYGDPAWSVGYLVQASDSYDNVVMVWRFATRWSVRATAFVDGFAVPVNFYYPPPPAYQYGGQGSPYIDSGDCRIAGVTFFNGIMETTQQVGYDPQDGSGVSSAIKTYRWDTTAVGQPVLVRDQILYSSGFDLYYPSATLTIDGDSIWALCASSPTFSPSLLTLSWRTSGLDGDFALIKSGEDIYNRPPNRWGDYFGSALDPFDMRTVWITGEYTKTPNLFGVWVAETNYKPFTTLIVADASGPPGGATTLHATLYRNDTGATVAGGTIRFNLGGFDVGTAVTDGNGVATLACTIPGSLLAGQRPIIATFDRSTTLNACAGSGTLTVGSVGTSLTVPAVSAVVGQAAQIGATLVRSTDKGGISGKAVAFKLDGVVMAGSPATTDANGNAVLPYTPAEGSVGNHSISASFAGDANYGASTGTGTLTIGKGSVSLAAQDAVGGVGGPVTLTATLTRSVDGSPLSGRTVTFKVGTANAGSVLTDSAGKASRSYTIPTGTPLGTKTITATFAGDADYGSTSATATLTVKFRTTLTVTNVTGTYAQVVALKATLKGGSPATPLPGQNVVFKIDGNAVGTAQTVSTGTATLAYVITDDIGTHVITAQFGGDGTYGPTVSAPATLTVQSGTHVTADALKAPAGTNVSFGAILTRTSDDGPLEGRTLSFLVNGVQIGSAVTDANGRAAITVKAPAAKARLSIQVKFGGETYYKASSGTGSVMGM